MRAFKRSERLSDQIKRDVATIVLDIFRDRRGMIPTISGVELSHDLKYAKVFYTVLGNPEEQEAMQNALTRAAKRIQSELAHMLRVRRLPELSFHFDTSLENGLRITSIIDKLNAEQDERKD
jgi:ribosome-binding factor A